MSCAPRSRYTKTCCARGRENRQRERAPLKPLTPLRRTIALIALALGGFGIGVTEFASMGLLPNIASDLIPGFEANPQQEIARAGIVITAYALGVVIGAPLFAIFGARASHTRLTFLLLVLFVGGSLASAAAPTFETLVLFRVLAGLPHGAYFGAASLIAARIMGPGSQGKGVALALSGLTIANVVGVPLATWLGQSLGWRWAYVLVAAIFAATLALALAFLPRYAANPDRDPRSELRALANYRLWIMIAVGSIGFGGFFAVYSYVSEVTTRITGLEPPAVPWVLAVMGLGMTIGNLIGGWASDRNLVGTIVVGFATFVASLLVYTWVAPSPVGLFVTVFSIGLTEAILIPSIQARMIRIADEAELLGAAVNHAAFNVGNGLGAWLGGAVIAAGFGYLAPGWVGIALALVGFALALLSVYIERRDKARSRNTVGIRVVGEA